MSRCTLRVIVIPFSHPSGPSSVSAPRLIGLWQESASALAQAFVRRIHDEALGGLAGQEGLVSTAFAIHASDRGRSACLFRAKGAVLVSSRWFGTLQTYVCSKFHVSYNPNLQPLRSLSMVKVGNSSFLPNQSQPIHLTVSAETHRTFPLPRDLLGPGIEPSATHG